MRDEDPRHGTTAGYRAGCRDTCCRAANTRYDKGRRLDILRDNPRTVSAIGTRRRVQALHCLGWSLQLIADRAGYKSLQAINRATQRERVTVATAERIAKVYDSLCMTVGPSRASRRRAIRLGYIPPLAWDDIDNDLHGPSPEEMEKDCQSFNEVDEVIVLRVLQGDTTIAKAASQAEKRVIAQRWHASGRSLNELERVTGWKPERYFRASA